MASIAADPSPTAGTLPIRKHWAERRRGTIALAVLLPWVVIALVFEPPAATAGTAAAVVAKALAWVAFLAGAAFRFSATLFVGGRKGRSVVTDGPYSITRHPLYFGSFLMALSVPIRWQSPTLLVGLLVAAAVYLLITLPSEERRLCGKHGEAYRDYCARVPSFWPRLWGLHSAKILDIDVPCLAVEARRALRWVWIPIVTEIVLHLRAGAW